MPRKARPKPVRPTLTSILPNDQAPGRDITVGDYIIEQVRNGVDPINAAATAGITPQELGQWSREGQLTSSRLTAGANWRTDFTPFQQDAYDFAARLLRATATTVARLSLLSEQIARGGATKTSRRTKTTGGRITEVNELVETLLPDADMIRWRLEKLAPGVYGSKATLNVTVVDLTDTDDQADALMARMLAVAEGLAEQRAIDTTATDAPTTNGNGDHP